MTKYIFSLALFAITFSLFAQENRLTFIECQEKYKLNSSKLYVENEVEINVSPDLVWGILIDVLKSNSVFEWKIMVLRFESSIQQYERNKLHDIWLAELKTKSEKL